MFSIYNTAIDAGEHSEHELSREEATVMARIISRATENKSAQTLVVLDNNNDPIEFYHNGHRFVNFETVLREQENIERQ